ncbi:bifunctional UDP-sugar hydrolase/5'-nucleotidase [Aciduricibacillus chroicocephali]|uniref:Bifunctional UDP-sugar hydrolase/5'-nucleotidase n=1 Tax=Aciduricibacillus chroicocephali TaxID=3054939 RepID=A0ABY9KT66_9BACI|nr:bifunctional UDP-sugar hydrolase/5'-nucleotidase [Bacillaceae bacterium 44XB]
MMQEQLYFYFTNDFHSNFQQWPRVAAYLKNERAKWQSRNRDVYLFDIGDHIDRVAAITEATLGKANVGLMNDIGYDAVTLGNNEGITLPHEDLQHLYDHSKFTVICSNLQTATGTKPFWLLDRKTIRTRHGTKIGIIGLTAPFAAFYKKLGWEISDPERFLGDEIASLKAEHDILILLSHLGLSEDEKIAQAWPEIDIIMGGHTHHLLKNGKYVNGVLLTAAGKGCHYAGAVHIEWDLILNRVTEKSGHAENLETYPEDGQTADSLKKLEKDAERKLSVTVAELNYDLKKDWFKKTPLMQALTETMEEWTGADCAMLNSGVILGDLTAGKVTRGDLHRICPHPINPCVVEVDGDELLEIIRAGETEELTHYELKGFGFRGKVIGKMVLSGIEPIREEKADLSFIKSAKIHGEEIDLKGNYKLATADSFTFGRLFPEIAKAREKKYFLPEFLRDLLLLALQRLP